MRFKKKKLNVIFSANNGIRDILLGQELLEPQNTVLSKFFRLNIHKRSTGTSIVVLRSQRCILQVIEAQRVSVLGDDTKTGWSTSSPGRCL